MGTIRCHYCRRISSWARPAARLEMCSNCAQVMAQEDWTKLARRQLRCYPEEWVNYVAAFIELSAEMAGKQMLEPFMALRTCDGCDGSPCGEAHSQRQVVPMATVAARNRRRSR